MVKYNSLLMKNTKFVFVVYFLLAGLLLFPSCKQKHGTNQTTSETQIEKVQEEQAVTDIETDSVKKRTFRTEHPVLFTIIILAILFTIIIVLIILKITVPDLIDKAYNLLNIIDKLSNLRK